MRKATFSKHHYFSLWCHMILQKTILMKENGLKTNYKSPWSPICIIKIAALNLMEWTHMRSVHQKYIMLITAPNLVLSNGSELCTTYSNNCYFQVLCCWNIWFLLLWVVHNPSMARAIPGWGLRVYMFPTGVKWLCKVHSTWSSHKRRDWFKRVPCDLACLCQ